MNLKEEIITSEDYEDTSKARGFVNTTTDRDILAHVAYWQGYDNCVYGDYCDDFEMIDWEER